MTTEAFTRQTFENSLKSTMLDLTGNGDFEHRGVIAGIYQIRNIVNNHVYIGSSANIYKRLQWHFIELDRCKHHNLHLQNAYNKYGVENFVWDILIMCDSGMLLLYEQRFIDGWKPAYNISNIAGKVEFTDDVRHKLSVASSANMKGNTRLKGHKMSDSHKANISKAQKGIQRTVLSEEAKLKISDAKKGTKHTIATKKAISDSLCGRKLTEEVKEKMSKAQTGRKVSDETRMKISNAKLGNHYRKGKKASDESRNKMSISAKKRWASKKDGCNHG